MSDQTLTDDALLLKVVDQIAPLFEASGTGKTFARQAALRALAAYHPESRADFVNIARILAFSIASLAALGIAAGADLTPAQKMRYLGRANALNRSADQTERMMMQRRQDQRANPPAELPAYLNTPPPAPPPHDVALDAIVDEALTLDRATTPPATTPPAATKPERQTAQPQPLRAETVLRAAVPSQQLKSSYRQSLLNRSAMPPVTGGSAPQPPA